MPQNNEILKQANDEILKFQKMKCAWDISLQLIDCNEVEYSFIGCKTLVRKLEISFNEIPKESILFIGEKIIEKINKFSNGPSYCLNELCIAYSVFSLFLTSNFDSINPIITKFSENKVILIKILEYLPYSVLYNRMNVFNFILD